MLITNPVLKKTFLITCTIFNKTISGNVTKSGSSHPEVFLGKNVLKIYTKFTREHTCRSAISIKLQGGIPAWVFSCRFAPYFQSTLFIKTPLDGCFWKFKKILTWPWTNIWLFHESLCEYIEKTNYSEFL